MSRRTILYASLALALSCAGARDGGNGRAAAEPSARVGAPAPTNAQGEPNEPAFSESHPRGLGYVEDIGTLPAKTAYLTFDDGPSEWTLDFLDILGEARVSATFFVVARGAKGTLGFDATYVDRRGRTVAFAEVLRRIVDAGHTLGNHTADHLDLAKLEAKEIARQLDENERLVNQALASVGLPPQRLTLIRPPFGSPWRSHGQPRLEAFAQVGRAISERGVNVLWDVDSTDSREWAQGESVSSKPGQVRVEADAPSFSDKVKRVQRAVLQDPAVQAGLGVIVLFHDTHNGTREALPSIIAGLTQAGYQFGKIERLLPSTWTHELGLGVDGRARDLRSPRLNDFHRGE